MKTLLMILFVASSMHAQDTTTQNLEEALLLFDNSWPTSLKEAISKTEDQDLFKEFGNALHVLDLVNLKGKPTPYQEHFFLKGIDKWNHILHLTLDAYKRQLLGLPVENPKLSQYYQSISLKKRYEKVHAMEVDSITGIYIPKDINDCIAQLDLGLGGISSFKVQKISEVEFVGCCYLGLHVWIRNNWRITPNGSRLAKYFKEQGVHHPCDITRIILTCYYRRKKQQYMGFKEMVEASKSK